MNEKITTVLFTTAIAAGLVGCSKTVTYADVEPLLKANCAACHTGDHDGVVKSGFSVESYETVMKGTRLGPVIVAGSAESSSLYRMVAGQTDPKIHMPHSGESLGDDQIETIRAWIDQGAVK
jgi:Planctomycete cytochrome C